MRLLWAAPFLLLLAACQTAPPPPLMSPLQETRAYGYAERQLGPEEWEVTYVGPAQRTSRFPGPREATNAAARTQAFDFMLWRAAQIALREGYPAFRIGPTRSNLDTQVEDYGYDPFWGPGFGYPYRYRRFYPPPYYYGRTTQAYSQARISADVRLLREAAPGDYVAADVIAQARHNYPGAEGPPLEGAPPRQ